MLKSHTEAVLYAKARKALRFNFRAAAFFGLMMKGSSKIFLFLHPNAFISCYNIQKRFKAKQKG